VQNYIKIGQYNLFLKITDVIILQRYLQYPYTVHYIQTGIIKSEFN